VIDKVSVARETQEWAGHAPEECELIEPRSSVAEETGLMCLSVW
jgi:hypothetical protein